jgi:ABC-type multidrug transport system fused ATPase/permease subunit
MAKSKEASFSPGGLKMRQYLQHVLPIIKKMHAFSGKKLYFNFVGIGIISLLESVGILLLIPMINTSGMVNLKSGPSIISNLFGFFQKIPSSLGISIILGSYVVIVIGENWLQRILTIRQVTILQGFIHQIRLETYRLLLQADWAFFIKKRKSDLVNLFTTEIGRVTAGINLFLQLMTSVIFTIFQVCLAFFLAPAITLFVLTSGLVLSLFAKRFIRLSNRLGRKTSVLTLEYVAGMSEQLNGIKDIKSNSLETSRLAWLHDLTRKMLQEQVEYIELKMSSQFIYKIASALLIAVFIFLSIILFHSKPEQFILIIVIFSRLWPKVTGIQSNLEQFASNVPAFKAFNDIQQEAKKHKELSDEQLYLTVNPCALEKGIECSNVTFRYRKEKPLFALEDVDLNIPANRMTAIVGRSGAGKSTLVDIIMGLIQPERGEILVDGLPLTKELLPSLRKSISYVSQDPFLFNASIRENLLMIEPNAKDDELWTALDFASCDFVKSLPEGLDTLIGDRGVRLSGGERQRIVLARAILRKPSILVLDEATSSLDTENETKIQEAISKIRGSMTIIVIAHRLSTIRNADQVIVLDKGKIVQKGGFTQLANEQRGIFSRLLNYQLGIGQ